MAQPVAGAKGAAYWRRSYLGRRGCINPVSVEVCHGIISRDVKTASKVTFAINVTAPNVLLDSLTVQPSNGAAVNFAATTNQKKDSRMKKVIAFLLGSIFVVVTVIAVPVSSAAGKQEPPKAVAA